MSFSKIQVQSSKLKHAGFEFSKKHYATARWGEVSPSFVRTLATPDQSVTWSSKKLARLSPLISPAFGRCIVKEYFQFVPWRIIFRGCNSFLAQIERRPDATTLMSRVDQLPRISTDVLMYYLCQKGNSRMYVWARSGTDAVANTWSILSNNYIAACRAVFPSLPTTLTGLDPVNEFSYSTTWSTDEYQFAPDVADYRVTGHNTQIDYDFTVAIKLTQRGSRFEKLVHGCGLPLSFQPGVTFSCLHLLAAYKAYFDIFNLPQYENWEETFCYRLIRYYDTHNPSPSNDCTLANLNSNSDLHTLWFGFFDELCTMYYTANADNISSQLPTDWTVNAPELESLNGMLELNGLPTVDPSGAQVPQSKSQTFYNVTEGGMNLDPVSALPQDSSGNALFSQFTDEFIKRAYYWCQKKTQTGNKIADLLRAKGLGGYVDLLDSGFLGKCETPLTISEVISTADTQFRTLGDYAGQCSDWKESSSFHIHNDEIGVIVGLYCVVPEEANLVNSPDMSQMCCTPQEFYNPILDGLGFSPLARLGIGHEEANFHQNGGSGLRSTFGLQPRYQEFKVQPDTASGGFALRSQRDTYGPFHLQKMIVTHENEVQMTTPINVNGVFTDNSVVAENNQTFPNAGYMWRYPCRYDFIGHYDRIFQEDNGIPSLFYDNFDNNYPIDNFMLFFVFPCKGNAPMLPTSKSFETIECENEDNNTFKVTR